MSVTETTTTSLGSRLGSSLVGVLIGIVLFIAAFPFIFWNEARSIKREKILNEAQPLCVTINPVAPEGDLEGKLVHFAGLVKTGETLSDPLFGQTVSNSLKFVRNVYMYQWVENEKSETKKKTGGSTETKKTYTYTKEWVDHPLDSSGYKKEGYDNPVEWPIQKEEWQVGSATLGIFSLSEDQITAAGTEKPYKPFVTNNMPLPSGLDPSYSRFSEGFYLASGEGANLGSPKIGDIKVTFEVKPVCEVSFAGAKVGDRIKSFQTKFGELKPLQCNGDLSKEQIFDRARRSNAILTWLLRFAGLLMFFFGLKLLAGPLEVLADILPFIGNIFEKITGIVAFLIALVLTLVTVAVAWVVVRPILGISLIVIAVLIILLIIKAKGAKKKALAKTE